MIFSINNLPILTASNVTPTCILLTVAMNYDQGHSQDFEMGDNLGHNFWRLVVNGANLGYFESKIGINGRKAVDIFKIRTKLCKSRAFWIEWERGHSPWLHACM